MRAMCGVQLKDRKRANGLILMLGLNETINHLAMVNSVCWYGDVLRREDGHVLRRALEFEVEGQRKKGRLMCFADESGLALGRISPGQQTNANSC